MINFLHRIRYFLLFAILLLTACGTVPPRSTLEATKADKVLMETNNIGVVTLAIFGGHSGDVASIEMLVKEDNWVSVFKADRYVLNSGNNTIEAKLIPSTTKRKVMAVVKIGDKEYTVEAVSLGLQKEWNADFKRGIYCDRNHVYAESSHSKDWQGKGGTMAIYVDSETEPYITFNDQGPNQMSYILFDMNGSAKLSFEALRSSPFELERDPDPRTCEVK